MTYAEYELRPFGYRVAEQSQDRVSLQRGSDILHFACVCPSYPSIRALGCPLHHAGPGESGPVERAKRHG